MRTVKNCIIKLLLTMIGGEKDMVALYALMIMKGMRTFESVPANLQPAVLEYLTAMELDQEGKPLQP